MHQYRVVERWADLGRCALQCDRGGYHLARALNAVPADEARLMGNEPHLGFDILVCCTSGTVFRVVFESIGDAARTSEPAQAASEPQSQSPEAARENPSTAAGTA